MDLLERLEELGEIIAEAEMLAERNWVYDGPTRRLPGGTKSVKTKKGGYLPLQGKKQSKGVEGYFVNSKFTGGPVFIATKRPQVKKNGKMVDIPKDVRRSTAARGSVRKGVAKGWKKRKGQERA